MHANRWVLGFDYWTPGVVGNLRLLRQLDLKLVGEHFYYDYLLRDEELILSLYDIILIYRNIEK
jgi:hypothetical protein